MCTGLTRHHHTHTHTHSLTERYPAWEHGAPAQVSLFADLTINRFSIITSMRLCLEEPGRSQLGGVWQPPRSFVAWTQCMCITQSSPVTRAGWGSGTETLPNRATGQYNDPAVKWV